MEANIGASLSTKVAIVRESLVILTSVTVRWVSSRRVSRTSSKVVQVAAVVEEGEPVVAGEGDEVILIEGLISFQAPRRRASLVSANWPGVVGHEWAARRR
jgi:hypothetical protein